MRSSQLYYLRNLKGKAARIKRASREEAAAVATPAAEAQSRNLKPKADPNCFEMTMNSGGDDK